MIKRIVVGFDGSEQSRRAALWAEQLAHLAKANIDLVAVARPPDIAADVETEELIRRLRAHYRQLLDEMRSHISLSDDHVKTHVLVGHPAERLLRFAEEHSADHLVVGHRSRNALQRWWTGSVARQVMDHALCSVTIVR